MHQRQELEKEASEIRRQRVQRDQNSHATGRTRHHLATVSDQAAMWKTWREMMLGEMLEPSKYKMVNKV